MREYVIEYQRGAGIEPWYVYRVVPKSLTASGKVWLASFATKSEAEQWIASRL